MSIGQCGSAQPDIVPYTSKRSTVCNIHLFQEQLRGHKLRCKLNDTQYSGMMTGHAPTVTVSRRRMASRPLGTANWTGQDREISIDTSCSARMRGRAVDFYRRMTCWRAKNPALAVLTLAWNDIEDLVERRNDDFWEGESTTPGVSWDRFMHGRDFGRAQPTILFCSSGSVVRRNAERIIMDENIQVDPRGIGLQIYDSEPVFTGSEDGWDSAASEERGYSSWPETELLHHPQPATSPLQPSDGAIKTNALETGSDLVCGSEIKAGLAEATLGGSLRIDGVEYGMTVAHIFESGNQEADKNSKVFNRSGNFSQSGSLYTKRSAPSNSGDDLDWALVSLEAYPRQHVRKFASDYQNITGLAEIQPTDSLVWIATRDKYVVSGQVMADYSLVALPGRRKFQRMWVVFFSDRDVQPGDSGSWVIDQKSGKLYGHIVATKSDSNIAYIVLAKDIRNEILRLFAGQTIEFPFLNVRHKAFDEQRYPLFKALDSMSPDEDLRSISPQTIVPTKRARIPDSHSSYFLPPIRPVSLSKLSKNRISTILPKPSKTHTPRAVEKSWTRGISDTERLKAAVTAGNLDTVKMLLDSDADVNAHGRDYSSALRVTAQNGNLEMVRLLLDHGADVNAQGGHFGNALQAAATRSNNLEAVKLLLDHGADANAQGGEYGNALQAAASRGYPDVVKLLLDQGADVSAQGGCHGNALQAAATRSNNLEVVKLLLDHGADVNAQGGYYSNALQAASTCSNNLDVIKLLLDHGADVNAQGGCYSNALQAAAAQSNNLGVVNLLLDRGADVNAQGGYYGNALKAAASRGHLAVVKLLLNNGADVNAQDGGNGSVLQAAVENGHHEIAKFLKNDERPELVSD